MHREENGKVQCGYLFVLSLVLFSVLDHLLNLILAQAALVVGDRNLALLPCTSGGRCEEVLIVMQASKAFRFPHIKIKQLQDHLLDFILAQTALVIGDYDFALFPCTSGGGWEEVLILMQATSTGHMDTSG